jgi:cell division protease FtsH
MVTRFGMSNLGPRTFGKKEEMVFLGKEMSEDRNYSNETAQDIDKEVSRFLAEAFQTAQKILSDRKQTLEAIANALLERETLEKDEFDAIVSDDKA